MEMVNGYVFLDLTKSNVYAKALKALGADKPVVIKDAVGAPYFVDSMALVGTNVVIIKGGRTITIANDNTITSTGIASAPTMENIVDLAGNKRFIEGEGAVTTISGVTITYNKWSLSGSHLMFVVSGTIANTTVISASNFIEYSLPKWVLDKISPIVNKIIDTKTVTLYASNYSTQTLGINLSKETETVKLTIGSGLTLTDDRNFRIQFDLLIDADYSE